MVESQQGLKATHLATLLVAMYPDVESDWVKVIYELIDEKELVELEYVLPSLDYRIKSFILPKGTLVNTQKNKQIVNE